MKFVAADGGGRPSLGREQEGRRHPIDEESTYNAS